MKLPEFTFHVLARWPDGDLLTVEHRPDRENAFQWAAEMVANGCEVRVEMIERNPATGGCLGVSDVTAVFMAESDIPAEPLDVPCGDCGHNWCTCDHAYDARREDDLMEAAE